MASELPLPMPKMSMTMETGELLTWTVAEGDTIAAGDVVAEVQTDKVDMEVESPFAGTVARLVAQPGDTIAVGAPIAYLLSESDDLMAGLFDDP
ncbi:2-oxo acid dehydrogenase subunit E2, partial [Nakamurella flava]